MAKTATPEAFNPLWPFVVKDLTVNPVFWEDFLKKLNKQANALINLATDVFGILPVGNGGTNRATLTDHAVLLGSGSAAVDFAAPSTAGFVLTDNGAGVDPSFQAIASSAGLQAQILIRVFVNC